MEASSFRKKFKKHLFVNPGLLTEATDFYMKSFGAIQIRTGIFDTSPWVELLLEGTTLFLTEKAVEPCRGITIQVTFDEAKRSSLMMKNELVDVTPQEGERGIHSKIRDPYGHIWAFSERQDICPLCYFSGHFHLFDSICTQQKTLDWLKKQSNTSSQDFLTIMEERFKKFTKICKDHVDEQFQEFQKPFHFSPSLMEYMSNVYRHMVLIRWSHLILSFETIEIKKEFDESYERLCKVLLNVQSHLSLLRLYLDQNPHEIWKNAVSSVTNLLQKILSKIGLKEIHLCVSEELLHWNGLLVAIDAYGVREKSSGLGYFGPRHLIAHHACQAEARSNKGSLGLQNELGENNCFLNVIIQSLRNLGMFRAEFLRSSELRHVGDPCVVCSLREILSSLSAASGEQKEHVSPSLLRIALRKKYPDKGFFEEGQMNDAAEVLPTIFDSLHSSFAESSTASDTKSSESNCTCIAHSFFGMNIVEKIKCLGCKMESTHMKYTSFAHNISAYDLRSMKVTCPDKTFEQLLNLVEMNHQERCGGCGERNHVHKILTPPPHVFTTVLGWQNASESAEDIAATLKALSTEIDISVIFQGLDSGSTYSLASVVCYYGLHYICFAYTREKAQWIKYDDKTVTVTGSWNDVLSMIKRSQMQPTVLLYEKSIRPMDTKDSAGRKVPRQLPFVPRALMGHASKALPRSNKGSLGIRKTNKATAVLQVTQLPVKMQQFITAKKAAEIKSAIELAVAKAAEISRKLTRDQEPSYRKRRRSPSHSPPRFGRPRSHNRSRSPYRFHQRATYEGRMRPRESRRYGRSDEHHSSSSRSVSPKKRKSKQDDSRHRHHGDKEAKTTEHKHRKRSRPRSVEDSADKKVEGTDKVELKYHRNRSRSRSREVLRKTSGASRSSDGTKRKHRGKSRSKSLEINSSSHEYVAEDDDYNMKEDRRGRSRSRSLETKHRSSRRSELVEERRSRRRRSRSKSVEGKRSHLTKEAQGSDKKPKRRSGRRSRSVSSEGSDRRERRSSPDEKKSSRQKGYSRRSRSREKRNSSRDKRQRTRL